MKKICDCCKKENYSLKKKIKKLEKEIKYLEDALDGLEGYNSLSAKEITEEIKKISEVNEDLLGKGEINEKNYLSSM